MFRAYFPGTYLFSFFIVAESSFGPRGRTSVTPLSNDLLLMESKDQLNIIENIYFFVL